MSSPLINSTTLNRPVPIDERFFDPAINAIFYFVDQGGAPSDFSGRFINEIEINPSISSIGRTHLAEWTFLLTEYDRPFAQYPFFVVSSRFHEKNRRLPKGLAPIWGKAIKALRRYGWAYLPSYDRDPGFEDYVRYWEEGHLAMTERGIDIVERFYNVRCLSEYRYVSDFFCNYIGFASRVNFEKYIEFYLPFIRHFFDAKYKIIVDGNEFCRKLNVYRNEKPFTFLLEMISHLYFYLNRVIFAGVSYDGIYEVNDHETIMRRINRVEALAWTTLARRSPP